MSTQESGLLCDFNCFVRSLLKVWKFQSLNVWKFQRLNVSMYESLKVSRFEIFQVCKFDTFKLWKFQSLKVWKFQTNETLVYHLFSLCWNLGLSYFCVFWNLGATNLEKNMIQQGSRRQKHQKHENQGSRQKEKGWTGRHRPRRLPQQRRGPGCAIAVIIGWLILKRKRVDGRHRARRVL